MDGQYKRNEAYSQEEIQELVQVYHMAMESGDEKTKKQAITGICAFAERFIYKTLWNSYPALMRSQRHRDDIKQEVWVKVLEALENFDPDKGALTTFLAPWIKHVATGYVSTSIKNASTYYTDAMQRVSQAQSECRQLGLDPENTDTLSVISGLPEPTVRTALSYIQMQGAASYESLVDVGFDQKSQIKGPEEAVIEQEAAANLEQMIRDSVGEGKDLDSVFMAANPDDESKDHASYREMAKKTPGSNTPEQKKRLSRAISKIVHDKNFTEQYPYIVAQQKELDNMYIPVLDCGDDRDFEAMYASMLECLGENDELGPQVRKVGECGADAPAYNPSWDD